MHLDGDTRQQTKKHGDESRNAVKTRVSLDAEEAVLEVRAKSLQTELVAKKVEKTLLTRTTESRVKELSLGHSRMRELRGGDAAIPHRKKAR